MIVKTKIFKEWLNKHLNEIAQIIIAIQIFLSLYALSIVLITNIIIWIKLILILSLISYIIIVPYYELEMNNKKGSDKK